MLLRDELGAIYQDTAFAPLSSTQGQPAESPWRLALVTLMQFAESLSDRQAADAVRGRIDWKYSLSLELTDPGFDSTVLCVFRARLLVGNAEQLLDALLDCDGDVAGSPPGDASVPTPPTCWPPSRPSVCNVSMRPSATPCTPWPWWLQAHNQPDWVESY